MSHRIWRRHLGAWLPALVFFALNLGLYSFYQLVYAGEARARGRQLERREAEVEELARQRQEVEELVAAVRLNRSRIDQFRVERLATEEERLIEVIAEVKDLARRAGVEPSSIRYPAEPVEEHGLLKRGIVFSVTGDYPGLRRFINFLELSDRFLTLEQVSLSGRSAGNLRIALQISTLFVNERETVADAAAAGAGERS